LRFADKTKGARLNLAGRNNGENEFFQLLKSGLLFWRRRQLRSAGPWWKETVQRPGGKEAQAIVADRGQLVSEDAEVLSLAGSAPPNKHTKYRGEAARTSTK
jgi:hypothetical protein